MVPLVGNIFTIWTNVITNGTIGKEIGANGKMIMPLVPMLPTKGYHWENPEHTVSLGVCYSIVVCLNGPLP